ncbi:hypothetical protein PIROE2DRAFT_12848 [Piromyces sp. E2]|nr:hypothetical protein PIROE2DRAFT_12848 [Piromyces sp. E2]|eukprot:OUM61224.1 hypothetical protein PIROE2DRAFT_12848 [Piromyces sp. E2]
MELLGNREGKKKESNDDIAVKASEDHDVMPQKSIKLIPDHYESFEHYNYTNSICHLTTVHPSLHKKNKMKNDHIEDIDLVNQMINDTHLGNEYQEVANILKHCDKLKTWTIYCRSGDKDEDGEPSVDTQSLSSSEREEEEGSNGSDNSNGSSSNENKRYPMQNEKKKTVESDEVEKENSKSPMSPKVLQEQFRKSLEEEMDYEQVSNYLDRGIYNDANEQSGTVMLLSEMINSASTYNINHNLQSSSGK